MSKFPVALRKIADLTHDPRNARTHSADQIEQIVASIEEFGFAQPIAADSDGIVRAGNGRLSAATLIYERGGVIKTPNGTLLTKGTIPVIDCTGWTEAQCRAYALADNKIAANSGWDQAVIDAEMAALRDLDFDIKLTGFDEDEVAASLARLSGHIEQKPNSAGSLSREFMIPPFSVLNAREGWWQERKAKWLGLGIMSEVGRGDNLISRSLHDRLAIVIPGPYQAAKDYIDARRAEGLSDDDIIAAAEKKYGQPKMGNGKRPAATFGQDLMKWEGALMPGKVPGGLVYGEMTMADGADRTITGTSIFDPVLCEIAYRWFSPRGGIVLDPFAGGSVRGIVAAALGRRYIGIDLRPEQIEANDAQWDDIAPRLPDIEGADHPQPDWRVGDSNAVLPLDRDEAETELADFIFSCPPYGDLEVYSDLPDDISNMTGDDFDAVYAQIIAKAVDSLKPHRFACFVIGDYRDKHGVYRNLPGKTIAAFEAAGASLYNEAILITATGSLAIRAGKQFRTTRKLGKTHQNILIFVKGDPRRATDEIGIVDISAAIEPEAGE